MLTHKINQHKALLWMDTVINAIWARKSLQTRLAGPGQVNCSFRHPVLREDKPLQLTILEIETLSWLFLDTLTKDRWFNDLSPVQVWLPIENRWTWISRDRKTKSEKEHNSPLRGPTARERNKRWTLQQKNWNLVK